MVKAIVWALIGWLASVALEPALGMLKGVILVTVVAAVIGALPLDPDALPMRSRSWGRSR